MMKCKKCNGNISIIDAFCICDSCGSKYALHDYFKNIDVYLCYVEFDSSGRRTKDSILAQDIYQRLQARGISTFYSRISANNLCGQDLERVCLAAINKAKVVVIIGTSTESFNSLNIKYGVFFTNKIVMPVFSDIDANQVPKSISKIQALDYGKAGASFTLEIGVLNALSQEKEARTSNVSNILNDKKAKIWLLGFVCVLVVVIAAITILLLGKGSTDIPSESGFDTTEFTDIPSENGVDTTEFTDIRSEKYDQALNNIRDEEYVDALELLTELPGYKDSDMQLQLIYDKYAGYYNNADEGITAYFETSEGHGVTLDLTCLTSEGTIRIAEESMFTLDTAIFEFIDSENNQGTITLSLKDSAIELSIKTTDINSDLYIFDREISFGLSEKSDKPKVDIDADKLLMLVSADGGLNLRKEASKSSKILTTIPDGSRVQVFSTDGKWAQVEFKGQSGYCAARYLSKPFEPGTMLVSADGGLNLRKEASKSSKILTTIPDGSRVQAISTDGKWAQVEFEGQIGYCAVRYLIKPFDDLEPNVFCPNCGHEFFVIEVGMDGFTCSQCGHKWFPSAEW